MKRTKEESEKKNGFKLNNQKNKIIASDPITSGQREGEKVEAVTDFLFLSCKITADDDCSHEIRSLLPGRKAMTNLDSVVKSRNSTFLTKVHVLIAKAMVFTLVMYGCES